MQIHHLCRGHPACDPRNIRVGHSETFVTEACEYTNSFLSFFPKISIILNIDADHLDFFKDIDDIRHSFRLFAEKLPEDGTLIINKEIPHIEEIIKGLSCEIITYALNGAAQYTAENIVFDETAHPSFDCLYEGKKIGRFSLSVPGIHNVSNALSAIALSRKVGMSVETIQKGLLHFGGTDRRFQYKGKVAGVTVIDDYAHHPTEIAATLKTAQNYPHNRICAYSSLIPTAGQRLFCQSSPRPSPLPTRLSWPTSIRPEKLTI